MKIIKYTLCTKINHGTPKSPIWEDSLSAVEMPWSEANEAIAKKEAHNGAYTIEDDGAEEVVEPTPEERIAELEEALALLLSGVTE